MPQCGYFGTAGVLILDSRTHRLVGGAQQCVGHQPQVYELQRHAQPAIWLSSLLGVCVWPASTALMLAVIYLHINIALSIALTFSILPLCKSQNIDLGGGSIRYLFCMYFSGTEIFILNPFAARFIVVYLLEI